MKVLAAMSGGVDSAVAAALARDAGHDVVGVHMALLRTQAQFRTGSRGCCSIEDAMDARRAADLIGIPFYVWDLSKTFQQTVVADFLSEYAAGRTPNPCIRCNQFVKFDTLAARADALGFDAVVTGHYARVRPQAVPVPDTHASSGVSTSSTAREPQLRQLHRAANLAKDQSYVLAVIGPDQLGRTVFPLGDFETKAQVRAVAADLGLPMATKPDSYDICFIPDGNTRGFLRDNLGARPGPIVDTAGRTLGRHNGAYAYTVGQRKGLALGHPAADGEPRYVVGVDPEQNTVTVGPRAALAVHRLELSEVIWYDQVAPDDALTVQVRAHGEPVAAVVAETTGIGRRNEETTTVMLPEQPLSGVATGQSAVVYRGTQVIAHGVIVQAASG